MNINEIKVGDRVRNKRSGNIGIVMEDAGTVGIACVRVMVIKPDKSIFTVYWTLKNIELIKQQEINGIIIDGKVYEAIWTTERSFDCHLCHVNEICHDHANDFCNDFGRVADDPQRREDSFPYFRFPQTLTDKIKQ